MFNLTATEKHRNATFQNVLAPFLNQPGLPFADVLSPEDIERVFLEHDGLFADGDIYSTPVTLFAFLAQVLGDRKTAACASAVANIATYMQQTNQPVPCGDTGDYCRARAKLNPEALRQLVKQTARQLGDLAKDDWLWHGHHAKLVDGFTFTMADTPANQEAYPQPETQKKGVGFPIARACVVLSLATAAIHDLAVGPYKGKETGETALFRTILDSVDVDDIAVFDRYYCSYFMIALLQMRGINVCTRKHQIRGKSELRGPQTDPTDQITIWHKPQRPKWMSQKEYDQIPVTLKLREIQLEVFTSEGKEIVTIVTTLLDQEKYPKEDIADLYGYRWNVELDIRHIKQTLGLTVSLCKSPGMVKREMWVTLLAYNMIRKVIATAAALHDKQPRQIGFSLACQAILSSWMLLATDSCRDERLLTHLALKRIAENEVANRPGRSEPRVIKRRPSTYLLMQHPRDELRKQFTKQ